MSVDKKTKKISWGIILCRKGPDGISQALLVKARTSFPYREFVYGRYRISDCDQMLGLFSGMTVHEKLLLLSLDFDKIWYHIWLHIPALKPENSMYGFYTRCRTKFERLVKRDDAVLMKQLIRDSSSKDTCWSIPQGRPNPGEKEVDCALRELYEEANVNQSSVVITSQQLLGSVTDTKTCTYISKFFVGYTTALVGEGVSFKNDKQYQEISDTKWVSLQKLDDLPYHMANLKILLAKAFKWFKKLKVKSL